MNPRRAVVAVCALLAVVLVAGGPVDAASKSKKAKAPKPHPTGIWMGELERHGRHWDYVGRACPMSSEICTTDVVRYRINPTTAQARQALKSQAGGPAVVWGKLRPAKDRGHRGVLVARQIAAATETATPVPPEPGVPGESGTIGGATEGSSATTSTP